MQPQASTAPIDVKIVRYAALVGGEVGAMIGEFKLAQQTGMPLWAAWTLPLLLSLYAYTAFRLGRKADVALALAMTATSQGLAHLVAAGVLDVGWWLVVVVWSILLPVALWRVLAASHGPAEAVEEEQEEAVVLPFKPTGARWKLAEGYAAIQALKRQGVTVTEDIGKHMDITPQRVGQIIRDYESKLAVA